MWAVTLSHRRLQVLSFVEFLIMKYSCWQHDGEVISRGNNSTNSKYTSTLTLTKSTPVILKQSRWKSVNWTISTIMNTSQEDKLNAMRGYKAYALPHTELDGIDTRMQNSKQSERFRGCQTTCPRCSRQWTRWLSASRTDSKDPRGSQ